MAELDGRVALVTGASSGIGEASARALAAAGARVVITGLHEDLAKAVAASITETGAEAIGVAFDTSDEAQVAEGIATAIRTFGGIDVLHNNAAITSVDFMMRDGMIHELDVSLWDQTMAVNVRGYMLCAKYVLPSMLGRGGGVIINTASGAGMQGELTRSAYGTSKAAVIGFTRNLATQYGKMGIRAVAVVPGLTMTDTVAANVPPPMLESMKRHTLTPTLASPQNIADAVVFLASDRAAFITGVALPVDGGFSVHSPSYADDAAMWAAMSGPDPAQIADRYRRVLAARGGASAGDEDSALLSELLADYASWHGVGAGTDGPRAKADGIAHWNGVDDGGPQPQVTVGDVYVDATHVVGVVELSAGGTTVRQANVFHLDGEGKVTELWRVPADHVVAEALAGGAVPEHPHVTRFRAAEEARARNTFGPEDLALIADFLREDVHWISPWGQGPSSRDEVVAQFDMFKQATGGSMVLELREVYADDAHAVSLVRLQADRPDKPGRHMDVKEANVFHLDASGRAYEFWGVADDQAAINSFWT